MTWRLFGVSAEGLAQRAMECASCRAPSKSPSPPAGGRCSRTAARWRCAPARRGEGGARSYAGQFLSLLNVPAAAGRGCLQARHRRPLQRAGFVLSPLRRPDGGGQPHGGALPPHGSGARRRHPVHARPQRPEIKNMWITATRGLGPEIASGRTPADLFWWRATGRTRWWSAASCIRRSELVLQEGGGLATAPLRPGAQDEASLQDGTLHMLAEWGLKIEQHFRCAGHRMGARP